MIFRPSVPPPPPRVLLVDDSRTILQATSAILQAHGCRVTVAASVKAALEALSASTPDVAVIDLMMLRDDGHGAGGGLQLLRRLRRTPSSAGVPSERPRVIVYTGESDGRSRRAVEALGAVYVVKGDEKGMVKAVMGTAG